MAPAICEPEKASGLDLSLAGIEEAVRAVDPVFSNTPQFVDEPLCAALGRQVLVKVETANPVRSLKGRGADFLMGRFDARQRVVCASTGNFGQAMAYAGRRRGVTVEVFAPAEVNPVKLDRMKAFGARVTAVGRDSAECYEAARSHAAATPGCLFIQDGKEPAIAEGAGTIGVELLRAGPIDTIVLPVGDGALIAGVACWIKGHSPQTRIIGVCAAGAPAMALSWRAGQPVSTDHSDTIADGIDVRLPVAESVARLCALVDDMVLIDDGDLVDAMRLAARTLGLLLEPSGAAGLAAIRVHDLPGKDADARRNEPGARWPRPEPRYTQPLCRCRFSTTSSRRSSSICAATSACASGRPARRRVPSRSACA